MEDDSIFDDADLESKLDTYKREAKEEIDFIMSTDIGRRFVWKLLYNRCGLDSDSFSVEPHMSNYAQGRQAIAIELKRDILGVSVQKFLDMERENYV